jgi:hypothetical protein
MKAICATVLGAVLTWAPSASAEAVEDVLARIQTELVDTGKATIPAISSLEPSDGHLAISAESPCVQNTGSVPVAAMNWRDARMNSSPNKLWYVEVACKDFNMCISGTFRPAPAPASYCPRSSEATWTLGVSRFNLIETDSKTAKLVLEWLLETE